MKLISEIFHDHCDGDGTMTPQTLRELLVSLCDENVDLWDNRDVDNILESWSDKSSIDIDEFLRWVYHDSAMLSPREGSSSTPRHLTINFDVNKTIVMRDKTANKSVEVVINEVLAETSWGRAEGESWVLISSKPCSLRPEGSDLVSYAEYLEAQLPGSDRRKERQKLKGAFTSSGNPGEAMATHHANLCRQLIYPDGSPVQVVHAFFRLLVELKQSKRSFSLIFRSFGEDLELVAHELNSFCEGKHPLFPGIRMDGSDGEPDYRFHLSHPERFGNFHIEKETGEMHLVLGTIEQPGEGRFKDVADRSLSFYETHHVPVKRIISGTPEVVDFIWELSSQCVTAGFRDNFQFWKMMNHTQEGGKFFLFDASRSTNRHEIFFDDNVHFRDLKIVRPYHRMRQRRSWWGLPLLRTHVCRADALTAINDDFYFVGEVQRLEANYETKLAAMQRCSTCLRRLPEKHSALSLLTLPGVEGKEKQKYDAWENLRCDERSLPATSESDVDFSSPVAIASEGKLKIVEAERLSAS